MTTRRAIRSAYRILSLLNTLTVLASGNPRRIRRRAANIAKARLLWRSGFWKG